MSQISKAFPAIFLQLCQDHPEFNSGDGVSFVSGNLASAVIGRLSQSADVGLPRIGYFVLARRLAGKAGRQSLID